MADAVSKPEQFCGAAKNDVSNRKEKVVWTNGEIICEGKTARPTPFHTAREFECTTCHHTDGTGELGKLFEHELRLERSRAKPRAKLQRASSWEIPSSFAFVSYLEALCSHWQGCLM
jgi:hypothetical protein